MYNKIWSPLKQEFVDTLSYDGKKALKMYVNSFMTGGAEGEVGADNNGPDEPQGAVGEEQQQDAAGSGEGGDDVVDAAGSGEEVVAGNNVDADAGNANELCFNKSDLTRMGKKAGELSTVVNDLVNNKKEEDEEEE